MFSFFIIELLSFSLILHNYQSIEDIFFSEVPQNDLGGVSHVYAPIREELNSSND